MRHALILAGGAGTRLWPMSRAALPKQLIPFINGKSLLQLAVERLDGLVDPSRLFICAAERHREAILSAIPGLDQSRYIGEPTGRDTLNAVGLGTTVISRLDPDASIAVFTADHLIEPVGKFRSIMDKGYRLTEDSPETLVTFGVEPTFPATGYGYLELGDSLTDYARTVVQFREKPDIGNAQSYFHAGPSRYLWNSGLFVWRAKTLLDCIQRYAPGTMEGLRRIADAWDDPERMRVLSDVYPNLVKTSVDYAVMEPASRDAYFEVAAIPMNLDWLDVGSWSAYAKTCDQDDNGNATTGDRTVLLDSRRVLAASSDPSHLIAAIGCEDLTIIHTPDATLVCRSDMSEAIKEMHRLVGERFGEELL